MNRFLNLLINAHTKLKIVSQKSDRSSEILERNLAVRPHQMQNNEAEDLTILQVQLIITLNITAILLSRFFSALQ